ncbi:hypothetical protein DOT_2144 [Desulfosporosinus sp. OT]|nr:hypothetical protein DOT_2144 [Desulfosporosinus sp. OT]
MVNRRNYLDLNDLKEMNKHKKTVINGIIWNTRINKSV